MTNYFITVISLYIPKNKKIRIIQPVISCYYKFKHYIEFKF